MNKAVIYTRVSSKDQEVEGFSISAQQKLLREYAAKLGLTVVAEFTDVETARKSGRTQFNHMLALIRSDPSIKHILVEKTDRLTRNMSDYDTIDKMTSQTDITIHLAKENATLSRDSRSNEKFIFGIKALMAKNYSDNLAEEVKKGLSEKAAQGIYPSSAPYGYLNAKIDGKNVIVIDPAAAPYVKKMFELYATGAYSLKALRKKMLDDGMVYRSGRNFYTSTVETILRNEFYKGVFYWKGKKYENASHPALISRDCFNRVQEMMRNPYKSKSRKGLFPYANLIRCGICGCALTAEIKKGQYIYYHCTGYKGNCRQPYLRQEDIDKKFEILLNQLEVSEEIQALILKALKESMQDKIAYHNAIIQQLEKQIKTLQSRIDNAYFDKLDKKISEEFWITHSKTWLEEKEQLTVKLLASQRADSHYLENANLILELAKKASRLFKAQSSDQKRRLITILVSNCTYKDEILDVELKPVFNMVLKTKETRNWCGLSDYFRTYMWN